MDALQTTGFLSELSGQVFLTQYEAFCHISALYSPAD